MTPQQDKALHIVNKMEPWWRDVDRERKPSRQDGRTPQQQIWDSGVFAASELIRRYTNDEQLSLAMHELCFFKRLERERDALAAKLAEGKG